LRLTRRAYLTTAASVIAARGARGAAAGESLRQAAAAKGLRYGALADLDLDLSPQAYRDLFVQQCAICAVDIWAPSFSTGPDAFNFTTSEDGIIRAAAAHGLPITGAHLLWYWHMPDWITQVSGRRDATQAVLGYATGIARHYQGKAWSWNAVNEALKPSDGEPLGLRRCWPLQQIGPDYIDLTFRAARAADPGAILAYNDAEMELATSGQEARRGALLRLLDDLARRQTPIDAVGLQSHLRYQTFASFDDRRYRNFLREIGARGLRIILTELDVLDVGAPPDIGLRDRKVADIYDRFLSVALDEPAMTAVVTWGFSDPYTWLSGKTDRSFARPDGLPTRPLPFDEDLKPTPAFTAIMKAFNAAPARPA